MDFDSDQQEKIGILVIDVWNNYGCTPGLQRIGELVPRILSLLQSCENDPRYLFAFLPSDISTYNQYRNWNAGRIAEKYQLVGIQPKEISDNSTIGMRYKFHRYKLDERGDKSFSPFTEYQTIDECDCAADHGISSNDTDLNADLKKFIQQYQEKHPEQDNRMIIAQNDYSICRYFADNHVKKVYLTGVHANMCFLSRLCGALALLEYGIQPIILKDMTDTRFTRFQYPFKEHFDASEDFFKALEQVDAQDLQDKLMQYSFPDQSAYLQRLKKDPGAEEKGWRERLKITVSTAAEIFKDVPSFQSPETFRYFDDYRRSPLYGSLNNVHSASYDTWEDSRRYPRCADGRPGFPRGILLYTCKDGSSIVGMKVCYLDMPDRLTPNSPVISIGDTSGAPKETWTLPIHEQIIQLSGNFETNSGSVSAQRLIALQFILQSGAKLRFGVIRAENKGYFRYECAEHYGVTAFYGSHQKEGICSIGVRTTTYNTFNIYRPNPGIEYDTVQLNYRDGNPLVPEQENTFYFFEGKFYCYSKDNELLDIADTVWFRDAENNSYLISALQLAMNRDEYNDWNKDWESLRINWKPPAKLEDKEIPAEKRLWYQFKSWNGTVFYMRWARTPQQSLSPQHPVPPVSIYRQ